MMTSKQQIRFFLFFALFLNLGLWWGAQHLYARWPGVPPVPSLNGALGLGLGDKQFAYRSGALTLQNLGDGGNRVTPLQDYDYNALRSWFELLYKLDPVSNHVSFIAAMYFGSVQNQPDKMREVVAFLEEAGNHAAFEKWRWLAHGVFLARHKIKDLDLALRLAHKLADLHAAHPGHLPLWTAQMPAFIFEAKDEKESARAVMEAILSTGKQLDQNEINFMKSFLEERVSQP